MGTYYDPELVEKYGVKLKVFPKTQPKSGWGGGVLVMWNKFSFAVAVDVSEPDEYAYHYKRVYGHIDYCLYVLSEEQANYFNQERQSDHPSPETLPKWNELPLSTFPLNHLDDLPKSLKTKSKNIEPMHWASLPNWGELLDEIEYEKPPSISAEDMQQADEQYRKALRTIGVAKMMSGEPITRKDTEIVEEIWRHKFGVSNDVAEAMARINVALAIQNGWNLEKLLDAIEEKISEENDEREEETKPESPQDDDLGDDDE